MQLGPSGFVDDITILATSTGISTNCQLLERAYNKCQGWAKKYSSRFNPKKSELIHFTKRAADNGVMLGDSRIKPSKSIRVLGVHLNTRLTPKAHLQQLQAKNPHLLGSLRLLTQLTWGLDLETACDMYRLAIRPVNDSMTYRGLT